MFTETPVVPHPFYCLTGEPKGALTLLPSLPCYVLSLHSESKETLVCNLGLYSEFYSLPLDSYEFVYKTVKAADVIEKGIIGTPFTR